AGWIWDGDAEPESHTPGERTLLRLAAEGRAIFGEARATAWKRWVWSSAEEVAIADADLASPWWRGTELAAREIEVRAGTPLEVPFGRADLASIALRGASGVRTHVEVFRGASRVAAFDWTGGERGRHGYADTRRWLRVARRGQAPLRVVVTGGRAKLVWRAYERVKTSTEWLDPLAPNQHALGRDAVSEMVALVDGSRAADARTATLLSDPSFPAREKALLAAAVLESAAPDAPMASRAAALVAADRSLEPFPALWLRAVDALRRSGQEVPRDCGRRGGGSDPSSTAARALLHSMTCTGDSRPAATAALESIVQKRPSEARWVKLAAYTSRREVGWVDASPVREVPVVETYAQVDDGAPDGLCRARGAHGTRWRVLAAGDHAFTMSTSSYLHVRVRDRATDWEGTVELDGAPVSVHGAAGIESRVGLDAGTHVLRISGDAPPLLVRWPSSERAECATLRDRARLYPLEGELAFRLGGEGAPTVARIEVLRAHGAPLPTELELRAGDVTRAVNVFAKGIARVEIPIGPTTSELSIRAPNGRGYVRVRYRVRADDADDDDLIELLPRRDAESWLADVERLSMRIAVARAGASDEDPNALLVERARALLALGYRWFAFRDWTLAGRDEVSFESLRAPRDEVRRLDAAARIPPFEEFDANELRIAREAV
ncbi:MAG: hypothetical protein KC417_03715, partial [Myxococcales bacterium]|nr:hypothetical protein [Myxococcales bacterium]